MNKIAYPALLLLLLSSVPVLSGQDELQLQKPRHKQLAKAYGFISGQNKSLDLLAKEFPDLARSIRVARLEFELSALHQGFEGTKTELLKILGEEDWLRLEAEVEKKLAAELGKEKFTREEAIQFIEEVRERAKGTIFLEEVREILLSANSQFQEDPELEFFEGWVSRYRTKDHPKAKGADISISIPLSWSRKEGSRPNVIQVFKNRFGSGSEAMIMLQTQIIPDDETPKTKEEFAELFAPASLAEMTPPGSKLLEAKQMVWEGQPAGKTVYDQTHARLDVEVTMRVTQYMTIHGNTMSSLAMLVGTPPGSDESLDSVYERFRPLFESVANSYVWNDRYAK